METPRFSRNRRPLRLTTSLRRGVAAVAACFMVGQPFANPVNPTVVSGTASFSQSGNTLTVTNSNGAIINWDKFSIKAGETTHFAQPSVSSAVLNRVLNDPSAIYGTLSSNGRVWLINPAGIMVGAGGRIDTAGFVASTLNVRNEDFLAGRKLFENTPGAANVINQGEIRTPSGGSVYLVGSNVSNDGIIHTPAGETILAAGNTVSLIDSATPGVKVDITGAAGNSTNLGSITAEAGRVGIVGVIARNSGLVNASSVVSEGGRVFLKASQDAYVDGNGRIVTTGTKGGSVEVLGNRVALTDQASIDASGATGGGAIRVGGDYQGGNPDVANARVTFFGPDTSIKADATDNGDGGKVIVWADDTTRAYGRISARGGATGGNGGLVETSGKRFLDVNGIQVDTRAAQGSSGTWLLDPEEIQVYAGPGSDYLAYGANWTGGNPDMLVGGYGATVLYGGNIGAALATTNVNLTTGYGGPGLGSGVINFHPGTYDYSAYGNNLSLYAYGVSGSYSGDVIFGSGAQLSLGAGQLAVFSGWTGVSNSVTAGRGTVTLDGAQINAKYVSILAGNAINVINGTVIRGYSSSDVGTIKLQSLGGISVYGGGAQILSFGSDVLLAANSGITLGAGGAAVSARRDGLAATTQASDTAGYGGRILFDADTDRNGVGSFVMYGGSSVGTTSNAHLIDATGNIGAYGSAKVAIGVIAADVELSNTATIKLNSNATAYAGAPFGGGDIAFLPTTTAGEIRLGNFSTSAPDFTLDNAELSRIFLPASGASNCGTSQEGCRIWIGGVGVPNDPLVGALPTTTRNIKLDHADFTLNNVTTVPKRVHLTTSSTADINDMSDGAGYFGVMAGHLSLNGGGGVGGASGVDGVEFIANSVVLGSSISGIRATSVGVGDLAIRKVTANGDVNLKAYYGGVTLLPYFAGQNETTPGNFNLTVDGDIRFAASGASYTIVGPHSTFTETAAGTASIRAGGSLSLTSLGGGVQVAGDHAAGAGLFITASNDITIADGGLASGMGMGLSSSGDLVLTGANRGTVVKSGGMMSIVVANLRAYGGSAINPGTPGSGTTYAFYGSPAQEDLSGQAAGVAIKSAMAQDIDVSSGDVWLQAGAASNGGGYGGPMYGGTVGIWSAGTQTIGAANIKLFGGAAGHDNNAEIQSFGDQLISLYGGSLQLTGGGGAGGFNNQARIQHGQWTAGVGSGTGNQNIVVYSGGTIDLVGGSGTGTLGYYGSDCYAVLGDACRGGSNDARIENVFAAQTINFTSGGQLNITGGSAGTKNSASIEAQTSAATTQQILGSADVVLTGGSAGGSALSYGGESHDLSNDAGIYSNGSSTQTVLAHDLTINGGTAAVGGAGISNESGMMLMVQTVGNLTMTGGSSSAASPYGGAAYIANRDNGLVSLLVGGNLNATSGSGSSSPVLIGSIDGQGSVQIAAANVSLNANASFVAVGSKAAAYGASVTMLSPGNISFSDSTTNPNGKIFIGSDTDGVGSPTMVNIEAHGNVTVGSVGGHGVLIGTATSANNMASTVGIVAGPTGYGGNLVINSGGAVSGYGGVTLAANNAYGGTGDITVAGGTLASGGATGYVRIYAGRNVDLSGTVSSAATTMAAVDIQAGVTGPMAPTANLYGGDLNLHASTIQGYGGVLLFANNATGAQGNLMQTGGSIDAGNLGANVAIRTGGSATLAGPVTAGGGIDIQTGSNVVAVGNGYGGDLSLGGNLTANGGMGVTLLARQGSNASGDLTQTAGTIYGSTIMANGLRNVVLDGNLTAGTGMLSVIAGDTMMAGYGGNLSIGSGLLQGYGGVTLLANASSASNGVLSKGTGTISNAGAGGIVLRGGRNVNLAGSLTSASGPIDIQAGMNGVAPMASGYGGNLVLAAGSAVNSGGVTGLFASSGSSSGGGITQAGNLTSAGNVTIKGDRIVSINGAVESSGGAVLIKSGHNLTAFYGGNLNFGAASSVAAYGGNLDAFAIGASESAGTILQAGGSLYASADLTLAADGSVITHGSLVSPMNLNLFAGVDNFFAPASPAQTSAYGGNVVIGSSSVITGDHVGLFANHGDFPDGSTGHVTQSAAAGTLTASGTSLNVFAAGDVNLLGNVVTGGAAPVMIRAGYDMPGSGPVTDFANLGIAISSLTSNGRDVNLEASGPISANLANASTITAMVSNSSSGGISISHTGATAPTAVALSDGALANRSVGFQHTGSNLVLGGSYSFDTLGTGSLLVAAPSSQLSYNGAFLGGNNIQLSGGTSLDIVGSLSKSGATLGLSSGGTINVNNIVQAANALLAAPTINIVGGEVGTIGDTLLFGSQINIGTGTRTNKITAANVLLRGATLGTGNLNLDGEVFAFGQVEFNLANVLGSSGGALVAHGSTSSITGIVAGNITLDGSAFEAGDDINLKLTGPSSTLSLLNGGYLLADKTSLPGSIFLDFPARSSGGLVVSGPGSGLFVGDTSTPASAANGTLHVTFDPASTTTNTPVVNDLISSTAKTSSTESPTERNSTPTVVTSSSSTQTSLTLGGTAGGTEGTFGADSTSTSTTGTTGGSGGSGSGTSGGESGTGDQAASKEKTGGDGNGKDSKDEKDKDKDKDKEKKDQAKEEKKDEKPAQKKVAQCSS